MEAGVLEEGVMEECRLEDGVLEACVLEACVGGDGGDDLEKKRPNAEFLCGMAVKL